MATQLKPVAQDYPGSLLCAAMAKAFPEVEGATKDKNNPAFRSKYADLGSVMDAIKPALTKHGLFFTQSTHDTEGGVCIETTVWHESGESLSFGRLFVPASKQDAQGYGSALTYARRYSLMTAFGVAPEDDDGNAAAATAPRREVGCEGTGAVKRTKTSGPIPTVAALKEACATFLADLELAADMSDTSALDALLISSKALIDQVKADKPDWWDHPEYGLDGRIAKAYVRVETNIGAANEPINFTNAG